MRNITLPVYPFNELANNVQENLVNSYIESYNFENEYTQQSDFLKDISELFQTKYPTLTLSHSYDSGSGYIMLSSEDIDSEDFDARQILCDFKLMLAHHTEYYSESLLEQFKDRLNDFNSNLQSDALRLINEMLDALLDVFIEEMADAVDYNNVKSSYFENCPDLEYFKDGTRFNPELLEE